MHSAGECAWVPGLPGLWRFGALRFLPVDVVPDDVRCWPSSVGALV